MLVVPKLINVHKYIDLSVYQLKCTVFSCICYIVLIENMSGVLKRNHHFQTLTAKVTSGIVNGIYVQHAHFSLHILYVHTWLYTLVYH